MTPASKPLADQVMVITGASSSIGLATAALAAQHGVILLLVTHRRDDVQSLASRMKRMGVTVVQVAADVAHPDELRQVAAIAMRKFHRIDTWVNTASLSTFSRLMDLSQEESHRLFAINFWGVVNGSIAALPHLIASQGALINVGCTLPEVTIPMQGMLSEATCAIQGYTDALRLELQLDTLPVSVTLINPDASLRSRHGVESSSNKGRVTGVSHLAPEVVAQAILRAATQGGRRVSVDDVIDREQQDLLSEEPLGSVQRERSRDRVPHRATGDTFIIPLGGRP